MATQIHVCRAITCSDEDSDNDNETLLEAFSRRGAIKMLIETADEDIKVLVEQNEDGRPKYTVITRAGN